MESYVMKNPQTGEEITCYWYESLTLQEQGWVEVGYTPDYSYMAED